MFSKILIANRGEIAVRIMRTCREMGIETVALYHPSDSNSLHVWMADESVPIATPKSFSDQAEVLSIAKQCGADAIHPGYGFLAERDDFADRCRSEGITFIGPSSAVLAETRQKIAALQKAQAAGFTVPEHSSETYGPSDIDALRAEAERLGYPVMVKSSRGGRGRGARLVWTPERLERSLRRAHAEALIFYGERRVYLEKAILPAHQVGVQILGDSHGNLIHLGDREGSLLIGNQKMIEESPAPCLNSRQRAKLLETSLELAGLFDFDHVGTVEFIVDDDGGFYFTEIKPRIQIEHAITEMRTRIDLIRYQIQLAAGEPLGIRQDQITIDGWSMQSRVNASDPWRTNLPSPGHVSKLRVPGGEGVRVDTYLQSDCDVPAQYDPLIAKVIVYAHDRQTCARRLRNALQEFQVVGTHTNLPLVQRIAEHAGFQQGHYSTESLLGMMGEEVVPEKRMRDLAVLSAVIHALSRQPRQAHLPERLQSGWHRQNRKLS